MTVREILEAINRSFGPVEWRPTGPAGAWRAAIIQEGDLKLKVSVFSFAGKQAVTFLLTALTRRTGRQTILTLTYREYDDSWNTAAGQQFSHDESYARYLRHLLKNSDLVRNLQAVGKNAGAWAGLWCKWKELWSPNGWPLETLLRSFDPPIRTTQRSAIA